MASSPRVQSRRSIDVHAHLMPPQFWKTVDQGHPGTGYAMSRRQIEAGR